jgi:hypothetical protein
VRLGANELHPGWKVEFCSRDLPPHHLEAKRTRKELKGISEHLHALVDQEGADVEDWAVRTRRCGCINEGIGDEVGNDEGTVVVYVEAIVMSDGRTHCHKSSDCPLASTAPDVIGPDSDRADQWSIV